MLVFLLRKIILNGIYSFSFKKKFYVNKCTIVKYLWCLSFINTCSTHVNYIIEFLQYINVYLVYKNFKTYETTELQIPGWLYIKNVKWRRNRSMYCTFRNEWNSSPYFVSIRAVYAAFVSLLWDLFRAHLLQWPTNPSHRNPHGSSYTGERNRGIYDRTWQESQSMDSLYL